MDTNRLTGKVALVAGAASGIGKATATLCAAEGARVIVADLNETAAEQVAEAIRAAGGEARARRLDVTCENDWVIALAELRASWARLDLCINCAGISLARPLTELSLADWRRVFAVNLDGVFLGTRHAMEMMKAGNGGSIINIASAAGAKALAGNAAYGASKAAVRFFTRVAALEGAPHHIRVNSISPGAVATPMWEGTAWWPSAVAERSGREAALQALVRDRNMAEPLDVARAVLFLAGDHARFITGADLAVDAGFSIG
jgi:3(or 17)beta-hydroxysteroid dehydrogenase